jgi:hypothetical protein
MIFFAVLNIALMGSTIFIAFEDIFRKGNNNE